MSKVKFEAHFNGRPLKRLPPNGLSPNGLPPNGLPQNVPPNVPPPNVPPPNVLPSLSPVPLLKQRRHSSRKQVQTVFCSSSFTPTTSIDFNIFCSLLSKTKVYSVLLVSAAGRILYANKLAGQHFEGSLNNFRRVLLQDLLVQQLRCSFVRAMQISAAEHPLLKFLIYSKNSKRRYRNVVAENFSEEDIFYRFLKCLVARVRPIALRVEAEYLPEGYWGEGVLGQAGVDCFLLESRLVESVPDLGCLNLLNDKTIKRYIHSARREVTKVKRVKKEVMEVYFEEESGEGGRGGKAIEHMTKISNQQNHHQLDGYIDGSAEQ